MNAFKMLRQAVPADAAVHAVPPVPSITGNKFSAVRQGVLQEQPPSTYHRTSVCVLCSLKLNSDFEYYFYLKENMCVIPQLMPKCIA